MKTPINSVSFAASKSGNRSNAASLYSFSRNPEGKAKRVQERAAAFIRGPGIRAAHKIENDLRSLFKAVVAEVAAVYNTGKKLDLIASKIKPLRARAPKLPARAQAALDSAAVSAADVRDLGRVFKGLEKTANADRRRAKRTAAAKVAAKRNRKVTP